MTKDKAPNTDSAADALIKSIGKKQDDASRDYRSHIQELIKNDFIYVTFQMGECSIAWTGKADTAKDAHVLILQVLEKIVDAETTYKSNEAAAGNAGYG